jgi:hypothetical protein
MGGRERWSLTIEMEDLAIRHSPQFVSINTYRSILDCSVNNIRYWHLIIFEPRVGPCRVKPKLKWDERNAGALI